MSLERDNVDPSGGCRLSDATSDEFNDLNKLRIIDTLYQSLLTRYVAQATLVHLEGGQKVRRAGGRHAGYSLSSEESVVNVLDVGCANACAFRLYQSIAFSAPARPRVRYVGLDLDETALAKARKVHVQARHTVDLIHHDITKPWPIATGWADVIWYTEAIEHVPVHTASFTLREARRVLAPTGKMLLSTPASLEPGQMRWPSGHDHEFTREELRDMIDETGWLIIDHWGVGNNVAKFARERGGEVYETYKLLVRRTGRAFAGTAIMALHPELSEDLVWLLDPNKTG